MSMANDLENGAVTALTILALVIVCLVIVWAYQDWNSASNLVKSLQQRVVHWLSVLKQAATEKNGQGFSVLGQQEGQPNTDGEDENGDSQDGINVHAGTSYGTYVDPNADGLSY